MVRTKFNHFVKELKQKPEVEFLLLLPPVPTLDSTYLLRKGTDLNFYTFYFKAVNHWEPELFSPGHEVCLQSLKSDYWTFIPLTKDEALVEIL